MPDYLVFGSCLRSELPFPELAEARRPGTRREHHAAGFIYRSPDDTPADEALARWATEIVPAVREAITR